MTFRATGCMAGYAACLLVLLLCQRGAAGAAELKTMAILTPETGNDYGWNQQGITAARAAGAAAGLQVLVADNLGYGDIRPILREMGEDGVGLIIAHASGYNTAGPEIGAAIHVPVAIVDRPDARLAGRVADYTTRGQEGAYLAGVLAARVSRTAILGIVVSGEPPAWNAQSIGFIKGARAEKPNIAVRYAVIGANAYADAAGGKRMTQSLIAAGADIIFGQGNGSSFGMLEAVEHARAVDGGKVWFIDVIGDKSQINEANLLSSVYWNLEPVYAAIIADVKSGKFGARNYSMKLSDNSISLLRTKHIPDAVWNHINAVRQSIIDGKIVIEADFDPDSVHRLVHTVQ